MARRSPLLPLLGLALVAGIAFAVWQLDLIGPTSGPSTPDVDLVEMPTVGPRPGPGEPDIPVPIDTTDVVPPEANAESTGVIDLGARRGGIRGRVVNRDRLPIPGAVVTVHEGQRISGIDLPAGLALLVRSSAETDAMGQFELDGIPTSSQLIVRVRGDEFARTDAGPFSVRPDATTNVGTIIAEPGIVLVGSVRDGSSRPVVGARLGLFDGLPELTPQGKVEPALREVITDDEGRFEIVNVARASGAVFVEAEGFASQYKPFTTAGNDARRIEVRVVLEPPAPIFGRIVVAPEGLALEGALVEALPIGQKSAGLGAALSAKDGSFAMNNLAPGVYSLRVSHDEYTGVTKNGVNAGSSDEVLISLKRRGTMHGVVRTDDGAPITRFDFRARFGKRRADFAEASSTMQRVQNADGAFSLTNLDPGFYTLEAWAPGFALTVSEPIRIKQAQDLYGVQLELVAAARIVGRVVDDIDRPIKGVAISMHPNKESADPLFRGSSGQQPWLLETTTDGEGRFTLDPVTEMTYQVEVNQPDHAVERIDDVVARAGETTDLGTVIIPRSATLQGYVLDGGGLPVVGTTVFLTQRGRQTSRRTTTNSEGAFVFDRLGPGDYHAMAYSKTLGFGGHLRSSLELAGHLAKPSVQSGMEPERNWTRLQSGQNEHITVNLVE